MCGPDQPVLSVKWSIRECQGQTDADLMPDKYILSLGSIIKLISGHRYSGFTVYALTMLASGNDSRPE